MTGAGGAGVGWCNLGWGLGAVAGFGWAVAGGWGLGVGGWRLRGGGWGQPMERLEVVGFGLEISGLGG